MLPSPEQGRNQFKFRVCEGSALASGRLIQASGRHQMKGPPTFGKVLRTACRAAEIETVPVRHVQNDTLRCGLTNAPKTRSLTTSMQVRLWLVLGASAQVLCVFATTGEVSRGRGMPWLQVQNHVRHIFSTRFCQALRFNDKLVDQAAYAPRSRSAVRSSARRAVSQRGLLPHDAG